MYNLAGLSCVQHQHSYVDNAESGEEAGLLEAAFRWRVVEKNCNNQVWDEEDVVGEIHPVFVVPSEKALNMKKHFQEKRGF